MKTKKIFLIITIIASALLLTGQGCVKVQKGGRGPIDGGVWRSNDKGETWQQKVTLMTPIGLKSLADLNVNLLVFDPNDSQTIYLAGENAGLFVSYDGGDSWQEISRLPKATVNSLTVDSKVRHIVYAAIDNRIFRSIDCCRSWQEIYLDIPGVAVNTLTIDPSDSKRILIGLADGRLVESRDQGKTWATFYDFKTNIKSIFFNQNNPQIVYLATQTSGLFRSTDGGKSWHQVKEGLEKFSGSNNYKYGFFDKTKKDALFILTEAGFFRSDEEAKNWQDYKLLTQAGRVKIHSFTVNPKNPNEIYYMTENTFYKSVNGGLTWLTNKLPTSRIPIYLVIHPENPNIIYLGTYKPPQK